MKIVLGTDLSEEAGRAFSHAVHLARRLHGELVLVNATEAELAVFDLVGHGMAGDAAAYDQVRAELDELAGEARGAGVPTVYELIDRPPDPGLAEAASELEADILVVGTHGRTGLDRLIFGSVAERTARLAECDVLVAREPFPPAGYRRILVPIDFTPSCWRAVALATELVERDGEITLLHCWYMPVFPVDPAAGRLGGLHGTGELRARIEQAAAEQLSRWVARASQLEPRVAVRSELVEARPELGIRDRVDRSPVDLIVMSSHGRRGLRRWILGSVAEVTVRHAACSVLIARAEAVDDESHVLVGEPARAPGP